MIKNSIKSFFSTPATFLNSIVGTRKVLISDQTHLYKLGKQCQHCTKPIIHRDSISVCQCYEFCHKQCLIEQLQQHSLSQCTVIKCKSCNNFVNTSMKFEYNFQFKPTLKDIILISICMIVCILMMVFLVNFKNQQTAQLYRQDNQEISTGPHHRRMRQEIPMLTWQQAVAMVVMFIFGTLFWLCLMGMVFKKKTKIYDIISTNNQIKVSAFEEIESKIRQQSQQEIFLKKEQTDL